MNSFISSDSLLVRDIPLAFSFRTLGSFYGQNVACHGVSGTCHEKAEDTWVQTNTVFLKLFDDLLFVLPHVTCE